jgi:hypothetical protein
MERDTSTVTAETISDEQIRDIADWGKYSDESVLTEACDALSWRRDQLPLQTWEAARTRCASAWNARHAGASS